MKSLKNKKVLKHLCLIGLIFLINFVEYIFLPLPYMVLDIRLFPLSFTAILSTMIKSIAFIALNIFLCTYLLSACIVKKNYFSLAFKLFKKSVLWLLLIRAFLDIVAWFANGIFYTVDLPVYFLLDTVFLILVFVFVNHKIKKTENFDIKKRTKFGKIQVSIAVTVFCVAIIAFLFVFIHFSNLVINYANDASFSLMLLETMQGQLNFLNVFLNCILWVSLWHIFGVSKGFAGDN